MFTKGVLIGDFSLKRNPRRGSTTEEENKNVDTAAIELINIFRKREAARGKGAGPSMLKLYTHVFRDVVDSLPFSQSH